MYWYLLPTYKISRYFRVIFIVIFKYDDNTFPFHWQTGWNPEKFLKALVLESKTKLSDFSVQSNFHNLDFLKKLYDKKKLHYSSPTLSLTNILFFFFLRQKGP